MPRAIRPKKKVKVVSIEVTQNKMQKTVCEVPQWEAHVVLALWGDEAAPVGEPRYVDRVVPDAADEMQRLADKYGPKDEDMKVVNQVYGSFGPGLRALANEIALCVPDDPSVLESTLDFAEHAASLGVDLKIEPEKADEPDEDVDPDPTPLSDDEIAALANAEPSVGVVDEETGELKTAESFADLA